MIFLHIALNLQWNTFSSRIPNKENNWKDNNITFYFYHCNFHNVSAIFVLEPVWLKKINGLRVVWGKVMMYTIAQHGQVMSIILQCQNSVQNLTRLDHIHSIRGRWHNKYLQNRNRFSIIWFKYRLYPLLAA